MPGTEVLPLAALVAAFACMFVFGGVVKGTLGVGLPLVVVPMLSLLMAAPRAVGMVAVPVLLSNLWQAAEGARPAYTVRRFAPLIAVQFVATVFTVHFTQGLSLKALDTLLALVVLSAVVLMALSPRRAVSPAQERWASPVVGLIAGVMGGISSLTGPIIISYLMALRLQREEFVGSISVIYLFGTIPAYAAMMWYGRFGWTEVGWSVLALAPMFVGMKLGAAIRHKLSEQLFRRVLFGFLTLLALMLIVK